LAWRVNIAEIAAMSDLQPELHESFGARLRRLRRARQPALTQRQLAELVGIDFTYLSKLENDQFGQSPSEDLVGRLAKVLDDDRDLLLDLAGKIQVDPLRRIAAQNSDVARFLRRLPDLPPDRLRKIIEASEE
jgi:HTH-type transcriptional regulator, competence development regulator